MARFVSSWSKDPSTKAGAVIVRPDRSVQSVGFNGFPKNMSDDPALYADREKKYSRVVHCEIKAMIHAREAVIGSTLYTWPFAPCDRCCVQMLQAGITRFVWPVPTADALTRWAAAFDLTKSYINEAQLAWVEIPQEDVVETKG
jgi:dCMP deaminase